MVQEQRLHAITKMLLVRASERAIQAMRLRAIQGMLLRGVKRHKTNKHW